MKVIFNHKKPFNLWAKVRKRNFIYNPHIFKIKKSYQDSPTSASLLVERDDQTARMIRVSLLIVFMMFKTDIITTSNSFIMKNIIVILLCIAPFISLSQNINEILSEIEKNNTTLKAYQNLTEAQKLETHTGIFPENPEIGLNYLWGDPSVIGNRHDISITQSFDFPTAYGYKKQIAKAKSIQFDLQYEHQRLEILAKAKSICIELIYLNAMNIELETRLGHASEIYDAYSSKFSEGETNILEKNKAALNLLTAKNEYLSNSAERDVLLSDLLMLNGGNPYIFNENVFPAINLPEDFNDWFAKNVIKIPIIQQSENEITISQKQVQLNQALNLPKFSTGYMSESVVGESFNGISVGMSIPLWENKNTVKLARAKKTAFEKIADNVKVQNHNQLKTQYMKALSLQKKLIDYKTTLPGINNTDLLKKALDAGQISLIDYMLELSLYYDAFNKVLETERDLNQAVTALYYFEL